MGDITTLPNGSVNSKLQMYSNIKSYHKLIPRVAELQILEVKNWLIQYHFSRNEFDKCKNIINNELEKSNGKSEYCSFLKGLILRLEGKIQESLDCFQKCYSLNPKSDDTMKQIARSLHLLGRQKLSIDAYDEAKTSSRKPEWDIYHSLGTSLVNMGQFVKGKELLRQAIQLKRHEYSFMALAKVHIAEGDLPGAIEIYCAAADVYPDSVDLAVALALLYMDVGDHTKAFEKFGTALALEPTCARALLAVGALMQGHGELDVALAKYKSAAMYIPESSSLWNNLGMCFFAKKRYVSAVSCLKRANSFAPFDWKILLNLGLVHLATQQYASAFHYLSSAVNLDPASTAVFLPLAVTLVHLGDRKNARYAFEEAVSSNNSPAAPINFALFLLEEGDENGALVMYRQFQAQAERMSGIEPEVMNLANKLRVLLCIPGDKESKVEPSGTSTSSASSSSARNFVKSQDVVADEGSLDALQKLPDEV